jgi:hypothetical protein
MAKTLPSYSLKALRLMLAMRLSRFLRLFLENPLILALVLSPWVTAARLPTVLYPRET